MIYIYVIFIVLLFVLAMQYFQLKNKHKPTSLLFLSLFVIGILVVLLVQKYNITFQKNISTAWVESIIFSFLVLILVTIIFFIYQYIKNTKSLTRIDKFWLYQTFGLVVLFFCFIAYFYYQHNISKKTIVVQKIFVKEYICYADSIQQKIKNYIVKPKHTILQLHIQSTDWVYLFSIQNTPYNTILIPQKNIIIELPLSQDTLYFLVQ